MCRTSGSQSFQTVRWLSPSGRAWNELTVCVCLHDSLLKTKESVCLYVAHNNPAAAKVYHRVGFLGLGPETERVEGVDRWLELGFDRSKVELGHW